MDVPFDYPRVKEVRKNFMSAGKFMAANAKAILKYDASRAAMAIRHAKYGLEKCCFDIGATRSVVTAKFKPYLYDMVASRFKFTLADNSESFGEVDGTFKFWTIGATLEPQEAGAKKEAPHRTGSLPVTVMPGADQALISGDDFWRSMLPATP